MKARRVRVDELLVSRGLAEDAADARRRIMAGEAIGADRLYTKPGELVPEDAELSLRGARSRYVGRGGEKLEGALEDFGLSAAGRLCLDLGASTGGFTHCLLEAGAERVVAVDVGRGQLHANLRRDQRVECRERTDFRELKPEDFPRAPELICADLSFITVRQCYPVVEALMAAEGSALLLVKPQFELPRSSVPPGGVVTDPGLRRDAVRHALKGLERTALAAVDFRPSRLAGGAGNQEYFLHIRRRESLTGTAPLTPLSLDGFWPGRAQS